MDIAHHVMSNHEAFANVTMDKHIALTRAWINEVPITEVADNLSLPVLQVRAWFGLRDLMMYENDKEWFTV